MGSRLDGSMIFQFSGIKKLDKNYFKTPPKVPIFLNHDLEVTFEWILTRLSPEKTSQIHKFVQNSNIEVPKSGVKVEPQKKLKIRTCTTDLITGPQA